MLPTRTAPVSWRPLAHRRALSAASAALVVGASVVASAAPGHAVAVHPPRAAACSLPSGFLTRADLPAGSSVVTCRAVGRVIYHGDSGLTIPEPGMAAGSESLHADGSDGGFQVEVARDGTISYPGDTPATSNRGTVASSTAASPGACSDSAYTTNDLKEYGTYNWYIGDGGMPGALSRSRAKAAFADAINNITGSYNNCHYSDQVGAKSHYSGTTSYEADINSRGVCTKRDKKSTWDAGDLPSGTVAKTCWWSWSYPGIKNDLREADVRYNTHDYNFTDSPGRGCRNQYDVRSVGTHEAGHVFGMGHVGSGHSNLTMYTNSFVCTAKARTLGKGDVLGLRSIY